MSVESMSVASSSGTAAFSTRFLYFYYLEPTTDPCHPKIRGMVHEESGDITNVDHLVGDLVAKARDNQLTLLGSSIASIPWRHRSYIAVVLEKTRHTISGLEFSNQQGGGMHPFKNIRVIPVTNGSGAVCENTFERNGGGPWAQGEFEIFNVDIRLVDRQGRPVLCRRGHNETGTNTGPPLN